MSSTSRHVNWNLSDLVLFTISKSFVQGYLITDVNRYLGEFLIYESKLYKPCNAVTYRATGSEAVFYIYFDLLEHN